MPDQTGGGRRHASTDKRRHPESDNWLLVAAAGLAVFMAMLDTYLVTVALPSIGDALAADPAALQWVVLAYFLPMVALVLPLGRWLDGAGHRPALLLAVTGFGAASLACAAAPSLTVLVAARAAQGAFAAMLTVLTPLLATVAVRPQARGRAMSVVTTLGPLGALAGPAVGGWLTQAAGWRALFALNVPVCAAIALLAVRNLPAAGRLRPPRRDAATEAALLGTAVLLAFGSLTLSTQRDLRWAMLAVLAVPILRLWRRLPTSAGLTTPMRTPPVRAGVLALALASTATSAVIYLLPFLLARQPSASPAGTGLVLSALPLAMVVLGPLGGLLADRLGAHRVALAGAAVTTTGLALLLPPGSLGGGAGTAWRPAVVGAGMGLFMGPNQTSVMGGAPPQQLATAGGVTGLARSVGFGLGPALATGAWAGAGYSPTGMRLAVAIAAIAALGAVAALIEARPRTSRPLNPPPR